MSRKPENAAAAVRFEESQFNALLGTLQSLVRAFAYSLIKDAKDKEGKQDIGRQARFLRVISPKLSEQDIADLIDSSQPTVHRALSPEGRKKEEKGSKDSNDSASNS